MGKETNLAVLLILYSKLNDAMLDMTTAANCFLFSIFIDATDKGYFVPKSKQAPYCLQ